MRGEEGARDAYTYKSVCGDLYGEDQKKAVTELKRNPDMLALKVVSYTVSQTNRDFS